MPCNALLLVGVGVGETLDLTRLAAEKSVKVRTDLVGLARLQVVALSAAGLEETSTLLSVTCYALSVLVVSDDRLRATSEKAIRHPASRRAHAISSSGTHIISQTLSMARSCLSVKRRVACLRRRGDSSGGGIRDVARRSRKTYRQRNPL